MEDDSREKTKEEKDLAVCTLKVQKEKILPNLN